LGRNIGQTRAIRQVSSQNGSFARGLFRPSGKSISAAGNRNHLRPMSCKQAGRALPQTAGRTGHNGNLTLNVEQ
jgi:hypothetical protein